MALDEVMPMPVINITKPKIQIIRNFTLSTILPLFLTYRTYKFMREHTPMSLAESKNFAQNLRQLCTQNKGADPKKSSDMDLPFVL